MDNQNQQVPINGYEPPVSPQPPVQPQPQPSLSSFEPEPAVPGVPKKKRGLLIGLIIAGVLVVLGASATLAYTFWYQNPEKIVTDGIVKAIKAKSVIYTGLFNMTGDNAVKVEVTGKAKGASQEVDVKVTYKQNDKTVMLGGNGLYDSKGDVYFKVTNVDTLLKLYLNSPGDPAVQRVLDDLIAKINNQWIRISADDIKLFSESAAKSQKCANDVVTKMQNDNAMTAEIAEVYKKHRFITVEKNLGNQNGSLGYLLNADNAVAKAFTIEMKNTQVYKAMQACDSEFKIDENEMFKDSTNSASDNTKVELWMDRWSHQITKFNVEDTQGENKTTMTLEPTFDAKMDDIKAPEKSITIQQLQSDIEALMQSTMSTQSGVEIQTLDNISHEL
jgi:hypothetical protein